MLLVEDILKKLGIFKICLNNDFFLVLLNVRIFTIISKGDVVILVFEIYFLERNSRPAFIIINAF